MTWWFGDFYDGSLNQFVGQVRLKPSELLTFELSGEHNVGSLKAGDFDQTVVGLGVQVNVPSDFQLTSYVQYDDEREEVGTNIRLRWTFNPLGDLFRLYNYNVVDNYDVTAGRSRWELDSTQSLVKVQ